ncbi:glycine receptor subunit alpha-2-like isoform X1 [Ostrea edulis]|uniref:glycine receptor subunit alpha-2-like isoform X1 n=1 Tax=Ostrea edulis TaxID=37623 RepID=UPI0024AEF324|nr:glycine receptor subunit alpha-2-like isoform X1 [Ostrea edulis]XP_048772303.2 glycine receptor subunit alpha-2-like isoform X1 [Ostrea edulis]XP_056009589.1 glycine receptor subunit alpha-2-like isoform X1 [Ostrea edulis]
MILTVILCLQFYCASGDLSRHDIIHNLLREPKYDPLIAPNYEDDFPTNISVQLIIKNIHSLDELHMDFSVDVIFRQQWVDKRLVFNHTKVSSLELDQKMIEKIWVPDSFFPKEKRAKIHDVTVPNRLLHIYKNGTVFYSMRIEMTLSCAMVLQNYPLDRQVCPITIESYSYTRENIDFHWTSHSPVQIPSVSLPQFTMPETVKTTLCETEYGEVGDFACLLLELRFERNTGYYISQIFIPSILIVVLSWVSFWVDIDAIPARVSLGVLTVLTMTTQSSGARSALPRVSYIKAIDVWMAVCLTFVFMALLEFAYINVVSRRKSRPVSTNSQCQMVLKKGMSPSPMMPILKHIDFKKRARHVDKIARVMFPLIFFLFNIGFWVFYLSINTENKF